MTVLDGKRTTDVAIQDQATPPVSYYLLNSLGSVTLAASTVVGETTTMLDAGHGSSAGEFLHLIEGLRIYQSRIINVNVNVLTLDTPFDAVYTVGADAIRGMNNLGVDGSTAPVIFSLSPPEPIKWHVTGFSVRIVDNLELDDTKFGGIAALTNGVVMRSQRGGAMAILGNAKCNGDLKLLLSEGQYSDKAGAGKFGGFWSGFIRDILGVVLELNGATSDSVQVLVQDDLTDLLTFEVVIQGHVVLE